MGFLSVLLGCAQRVVSAIDPGEQAKQLEQGMSMGEVVAIMGEPFEWREAHSVSGVFLGWDFYYGRDHPLSDCWYRVELFFARKGINCAPKDKHLTGIEIREHYTPTPPWE